MSQIQQGPPFSLIAGDSLTFSVNDPCHSSDEWSLVFTLFNPGGAPATFSGAAVAGGTFTVTITGPQTETVLPKEYSAAYVFSKSGERKTVPVHAIWIIPDQTKTLPPSPNQVLLTSFQAAQSKLSSGTNLTVDVNGQSFTKRNLEEINKQIVYLQSRVLRESEQLKALLNQPTSGRTVTEFIGRPGYLVGGATWR